MKTKAIRVDSLANAGPGAFRLLGDGPDRFTGMQFVCPCGCGDRITLDFDTFSGPPHWRWNGDRSSPTLTPSIQRLVGCRWHGFLTAGEFVTI